MIDTIFSANIKSITLNIDIQMKCPKAPYGNTKVIESRLVASGTAIRRRRQCIDAGHRFTTYERVERPSIVVVKKNGQRQIFDRMKITEGIQRACDKTTVTVEQVEDLVALVEEKIYATGKAEVNADFVGELVMEQLAQLNDVAYVRFASVYRSFKDISSFERELSRLKKRLYDD